MSLRATAFADFARILESDGVLATLVAPDATEHPVRAQVTRIEARLDPVDNVQVDEPKLAVTVALSGLTVEPMANQWRVRTSDANGTELTRMVAEVRVDRTLGMVTMILEEFGG